MPLTDAPGRFGAVATAMVTPFGEQGEVDLDGAVSLARWLVDHGTDALVLTGSTGEATSLSDQERVDLWRAVASSVTVPVIAGSGSAGTDHTVELTRAAEGAGVDAVLVVTPYYSRPPQAALAAHFRAAASSTSLPVLLYDIPSRTGAHLGTGTILTLAREVSNVVGIKDAGGDVASSARLVAAAPPGFELYSGEDRLTLPLLAVGAVGVVSVASHWAGEEMAEVVRSFCKGDAGRARDMNARLIASFDFESSETAPNPLPAKAMMRVLGLPAGQCRMPLGPAPESLDHEARNVLAQLRRTLREARPGTAAAGPGSRVSTAASPPPPGAARSAAQERSPGLPGAARSPREGDGPVGA